MGDVRFRCQNPRIGAPGWALRIAHLPGESRRDLHVHGRSPSTTKLTGKVEGVAPPPLTMSFRRPLVEWGARLRAWKRSKFDASRENDRNVNRGGGKREAYSSSPHSVAMHLVRLKAVRETVDRTPAFTPCTAPCIRTLPILFQLTSPLI